jgi:hypothetical protein
VPEVRIEREDERLRRAVSSRWKRMRRNANEVKKVNEMLNNLEAWREVNEERKVEIRKDRDGKCEWPWEMQGATGRDAKIGERRELTARWGSKGCEERRRLTAR